MSANDPWAGCQQAFDSTRALIRDAQNVVLEELERQQKIKTALGAADAQRERSFAERFGAEVRGRVGGAR